MTAGRTLAAPPAPDDTASEDVERDAGRRQPRPSATRNASLSRANHVHQLRLGNVRALRHGAFARVQAAVDVQTEIALTLVTYPDLDPIRDRRLVEQLAETRVTVQRTHLAMATEGMTPTLTAFLAKVWPLEERLERTVHERERQRVAERAKGGADPLSRYRSEGSGS